MLLRQGFKALGAWVSANVFASGYQDRLIRALLLLDGKLAAVEHRGGKFDPRALYCAFDMAAIEEQRDVCASARSRTTSRLAVEHGKATVMICTWAKEGDPTPRYHLAPAAGAAPAAAATPSNEMCATNLVPLPPWRHPRQRQAPAGLRFAGLKLLSTGEVVDLTKQYKRLTVHSAAPPDDGGGVQPELAVYLLYQLLHADSAAAAETTLTDCEYIFRGRPPRKNTHA